MKLVKSFALAAIAVFVESWLTMLTVGVLHGWWPAIPVMAYEVALALSGLLALAVLLRTIGKEVME